MEPLLQVEGVSKSYGGRKVLKDVAFILDYGESVVLAGRNGSGKSTLLRLITGLDKPDDGRVILGGDRAGESSGLGCSMLGYVPERMPLLRFTPDEYMLHMGAIRGMGKGEILAKTEELLEFCRLKEARRTLIRHFSKGMLQKVGIMQAMLGRPKLLLMDEPFSGLDTASQEDLLQLLIRLNGEGTALLFASHEPELAERLASRMFLLEGAGQFRDTTLLAKRREQMNIRTSILPAGIVEELMVRHEGLRAVKEGEDTVIIVPADRSDQALLEILEGGGSIRGVYKARSEGSSGRLGGGGAR